MERIYVSQNYFGEESIRFDGRTTVVREKLERWFTPKFQESSPEQLNNCQAIFCWPLRITWNSRKKWFSFKKTNASVIIPTRSLRSPHRPSTSVFDSFILPAIESTQPNPFNCTANWRHQIIESRTMPIAMIKLLCKYAGKVLSDLNEKKTNRKLLERKKGKEEKAHYKSVHNYIYSIGNKT